MHQCICGCERLIVSSWNIIHHNQPKGQLHIGLPNILTSLHRSCLVPAGEKLSMPQFYKDLWWERIESIKVHPWSISFMQFFGPWLSWGSMISWQTDLVCSFSTVPMGHFRQHALPIPQKAQRPDLMSRINRARICWKKLLSSLTWFENKVDHLQILQPMSNHLVSNGAE